MRKILQGVTITNTQDGGANGEVQFCLADLCESRVCLFPLGAIFRCLCPHFLLLYKHWCGDTHMSFHLLFNPVSPHSSPSPVRTPGNTYRLGNGSLTTTANHTLTSSFSIYFHEQRKRQPASALKPTSHAYQLCQPANGRVYWTAGDRNKRSPFGPTRFIYNPSATPDVLDIVITKKLSFLVYLTSCSALSLDHLPVLVGTSCRSSFHHQPDRPDWANFQTHLEELIPFDPELHNEMAIDTCVENFSGAVMMALAASTPKRRPRDDPWPPIPTSVQD